MWVSGKRKQSEGQGEPAGLGQVLEQVMRKEEEREITKKEKNTI